MEPSIIKRERVRLGEPPQTRPGPAGLVPAPARAATAACRAPRAELVRVAGEVRAIELTCACGEVTLVEIELAGAPARNGGER
jgi:hypothetical protein